MKPAELTREAWATANSLIDSPEKGKLTEIDVFQYAMQAALNAGCTPKQFPRFTQTVKKVYTGVVPFTEPRKRQQVGVQMPLAVFLASTFQHWEDGTFAIEQTYDCNGQALYVVGRFDMPGKVWRYSVHGMRLHMDATRIGKASF